MRMRPATLAVALVLSGTGAARAAAPETFPLGRSAASGAVCEAVRDYQDPAAQGRDARAWRVRCRGYTTTLGRIYELPADRVAAHTQALATRARCEAPKAATRPAACRMTEGAAPYVVFRREVRGRSFVAEGVAPVADVLETGLKVAAGEAKPPTLMELQTSTAQAEIAADFPDLKGLAAAEAAAASDPARLRGRGYVQNNEWRFDEAETVFRGLVNEAEARNAAPADRAEALLNLALNVSNNGRFDEAEAYFRDAEGLIPADDVLLRARGLNYRALHERNRGRFPQAIATAERALQARAAAVQAAAARPAGASGPLVIDDAMARRLNVASPAQAAIEPPRISVADQLAIQDAQALQVIGTSRVALGEGPAARQTLARARDLLARAATAGRTTAWLQSRVEADLAALDLREGRTGAAIAGYQRAVATLRTRHAGSSTEGALLLDLGRAEAQAGQDEAALASFRRAMAIFRDQRGGLGGSADAAAPYFDLLLKIAAAEPGRAAALNAEFFDASQTVVSSATAETVNRLAARVASGEDAVAGLARGFEDAQRRVRAMESQIAALQADGAYTEELRAELDARLREETASAGALEAQLLAASPRYNQLVAAGAPAGEVQKALKPGEAYLKVLPLAGRAYGVLVMPGGVKPYAIALTRTQVDAEVKAMRRSLVSEGELVPFDLARSAALFDQLAGPVKAEVLASKHLIYEPGGSLVALPAAVFVTRAPAPAARADYTQAAWLGRSVDTSLVVSGASFLQSRRFATTRASQPFIGFGDPALPRSGEKAYSEVLRSPLRRRSLTEQVCGQTRTALLSIEALPETADEVRRVGASLGAAESVVIGRGFTDDAVKQRTDLSQYRVLYFATHALLPQPEACIPEPALVTGLGGEGSDALLDSSEILGLKLDADLVVLAACDTGGAGAGEERTGLKGGGEALGGLTRAMIYAGSRGMVVSHWSVDSASASRLMTGLFDARAPTVSEAMRQSQLALIQDPMHAHPFYWAPFTVVGDGARPMPGAAPATAD